MSNKNFDEWNKKKKIIDKNETEIFFQEREIWWCSLGMNVGFEQDGKKENFSRPVVILKKFNLSICLIVPLTTTNKSGRYYFDLGLFDDKVNKAIISQIRLVDSKRFINKIGMVNKETFSCLSDEIVKNNFKR